MSNSEWRDNPFLPAVDPPAELCNSGLTLAILRAYDAARDVWYHGPRVVRVPGGLMAEDAYELQQERDSRQRAPSPRPPPAPTIGRTLHYILTQADSEQVMRRRTHARSIAQRIEENTWPLGAQAHIGNPADPGDIAPLYVTKVNGDGTVNGQALLDGTDVLWVTGKSEGTEPGTWQWPPKV
jgi:hypothetical protein